MYHSFVKLTYTLVLLCAVAPLRAQGADSLVLPAAFVEPDTLKARVSSLIRLGFDQLEREDPQTAKQTFRQALSLNSEDPRIYIGLGRCFMDRKSRKLRILEIIERLFDKDYLSQAINNFQKAVELDSKNWEAHYWLATSYMKRVGSKDLERALEHMSQAFQLGGSRKDIRLRLALLHKALGDIENAEQILAELGGSGDGPVDPLANLELAKIEVGRKNYNQALLYYWRGVQGISTQEELNAYYDNIAVIATEQEQERFSTLKPDGAYNFFRSFWLKRDYQLGLSPGVRFIEHQHRLAVADSLFRVPFAARNPAITPLAPYYPEGDVPYDDRGIIYIRHGSPDKTISHMGEGFHPNESWVYYRGSHDFILHFVALGRIYEYQLVSTLDAAVKNSKGLLTDSGSLTYPSNAEEQTRLQWLRELYESRVEIGSGIYFRLYNDPGDQFNRMEEFENNAIGIATALQTESVESPYRQRLTSFYDLVEFRGTRADKSVLEFYAGVPGQEIAYQAEKEGYSYNIAYQFVVYNQDWQQVENLEKVEQYETMVNPHDLMDKLVVGLGKVELNPGSYYYFVKIRNGEAVGNFNGQIAVDSFAGDSLKSSQILAAQNIFTTVADSGKFKRYNLEVQPNPSRIYHPTDKMFAYQEIYNLRPDSTGNCNYRLTYIITSVKRDRNVLGRIVDTFKGLMTIDRAQERVVLAVDKKKVPMAERMVHEDVAIDISDNPDGLYELSIRVEDLNNSGSVFQRNTRFVVRR
ncbi:MAG TPA: tetratricopeptide repeat protein [archaeon]|nr:tetratricopeptide repeat protein [archaeon]